VMGYDLLRRSRLSALWTVVCGSSGSVKAVSVRLGLVSCGSFRYGGLGEVWRGMISLDELEFGRAVMARYDLLS
jgi:hypothetical protein